MEKRKSLFHPVSEEILEAIRKSESIALISHVNPDGDAVFSSLAMAEILKSLNKKVHLFNDGPFKSGETLKYESMFSSSVPESLKRERPLVIILDCSTEDRTGNVYQELRENDALVIDHHSSGTRFYKEELSYIVPLSPSTTLLVDEVRKALNIPLTRILSEYMLKGFLTDTGFFHFLSDVQGPECLEKVRDFLSSGLNLYEIYDELNDGKSLDDIKLSAKMILESESCLDGKVIIAYEKKEYDGKAVSTDRVYQSLLECSGLKAVVLIKEKEDGVVFGLRAKRKGGIDVGKLASTFAGGGHKLAAGATVKGLKTEDAKDFILKRLEPLV